MYNAAGKKLKLGWENVFSDLRLEQQRLCVGAKARP